MKAETDQFVEGLEALGVPAMAKKYPDLMMPLFTSEATLLTMGRWLLLPQKLWLHRTAVWWVYMLVWNIAKVLMNIPICYLGYMG